MKSLRFFAAAVFISLAQLSFSQEPKLKSDKQISSMHYYSFQGQASSEQLEFLQQEFRNMEFVTEAKIEYKPEKSAGQVRLITRENAVVSEGEKQFSAVNIKRTLISKGFMPVEYHKETLTNP